MRSKVMDNIQFKDLCKRGSCTVEQTTISKYQGGILKCISCWCIWMFVCGTKSQDCAL